MPTTLTITFVYMQHFVHDTAAGRLHSLLVHPHAHMAGAHYPLLRIPPEHRPQNAPPPNCFDEYYDLSGIALRVGPEAAALGSAGGVTLDIDRFTTTAPFADATLDASLLSSGIGAQPMDARIHAHIVLESGRPGLFSYSTGPWDFGGTIGEIAMNEEATWIMDQLPDGDVPLAVLGGQPAAPLPISLAPVNGEVAIEIWNTNATSVGRRGCPTRIGQRSFDYAAHFALFPDLAGRAVAPRYVGAGLAPSAGVEPLIMVCSGGCGHAGCKR